MANHKSAKKACRRDKKKHLRNVAYLSEIKTVCKKVTSSLAQGEKDKTEELLKQAIRTIDKTCSKRVIHHNTASRKISRLSKKAALAGKPV